MEAVAWLAGEPHSAAPACACPVITAFMTSWNDAIRGDETRTRLLRPVLPNIIGTRSTRDVEQRRADLALDWLVRVQTPAWLELTPTLQPHAAALRALRPLLDRSAILAAQSALDQARTSAAAARTAAPPPSAAWAAAWAAAWDAARDAARDAAWAAARADAWAAACAAALNAAGDAAWDAAWDAARDAARAAALDAAWAAALNAAGDAAMDAARAAAGDAARDAACAAACAAAWNAARDAAGDAARAAAWAALAPTVPQLQISAIDLLERMIAVAP